MAAAPAWRNGKPAIVGSGSTGTASGSIGTPSSECAVIAPFPPPWDLVASATVFLSSYGRWPSCSSLSASFTTTTGSTMTARPAQRPLDRARHLGTRRSARAPSCACLPTSRRATASNSGPRTGWTAVAFSVAYEPHCPATPRQVSRHDRARKRQVAPRAAAVVVARPCRPPRGTRRGTRAMRTTGSLQSTRKAPDVTEHRAAQGAPLASDLRRAVSSVRGVPHDQRAESRIARQRVASGREIAVSIARPRETSSPPAPPARRPDRGHRRGPQLPAGGRRNRALVDVERDQRLELAALSPQRSIVCAVQPPQAIVAESSARERRRQPCGPLALSRRF